MKKLNTSELKILRTYLSPYIVFGSFAVIFPVGIILILHLLNKFPNQYIVALLLALSLILGLFVFLISSVKIRKDLRLKEKNILVKKLISIDAYEDVEPGSGKLYIPILASLFPKLWKHEMITVTRYRVQLENENIEISEEDYNLLKDKQEINLCYAKNSGIFVGVE